MQKSIFKRYLGITMVIVFLSFVMLGSMLMFSFSKYWRQEKRELLTKNAASIAQVAKSFLKEKEEDRYALETDLLLSFVNIFSQSVDADIFITDGKGNILLGNYNNSGLENPAQVTREAVDRALAGLYEGRGDLGGMYPSEYYIIGVPMVTSEDTVVGTVFAATSAATVNTFRMEALKIFLWAAAAALGVSFLVVGLSAYRLVKPLRQMSAAARSFGAGDFSVRVPVTSNDELGQLAMSFNHMAASLASGEGMRRSFIANVSHELKTPMTTIAGFIDGILDGTIPQSEQRKYLEIVSSEVKRLSRLVRSMLDLSRIDSGEMKLNPQTFDLSATVFQTLLTFEQSIEQRQLEIRGLEEAGVQNVFGDPDLLHQVIYNLIENAVKFTNPGGYILFQISSGIDRTSVAIENSGQGIPAEELPMIFDRFYKTDKSRSRDKNGMGLGLYIVKTILKLHGGDITVSSVEGQYCRFEFFLPKLQEAPRLKEGSSGRRERIRERQGKEEKQEDLPESGQTGR